MNKCIFIGNLASDPEVRITTTGKKMCLLRLAVQRSYANKEGVREADFLNFTGFDKTAELAEKYLSKGRKVAIESHAQSSSWEKDGQRQYRTDFIIEHLEFVSSGQQTTAESATASAPAQGVGIGGFTQVDDDELPF